MAYKTLKGLGLSFDLIRAEDIKTGVLNNYKMLFVPGGWASNKGRALGDSGLKSIRQFVENGGNYLGFCGGAGLATEAKGGLGLLNVKRRPTKERVPSFSGRIELDIDDHPMWKSRRGNPPWLPRAGTGACPYGPVFHAWWPSQFIVEDNSIKVLATYGDALPDSFSSDLNVGDVELTGDWAAMEKLYGINLNPSRLKNEPAVIEGACGNGRVILSLVHFDTPEDSNGRQVLINLWDYMAGEKNSGKARKRGSVEAKTCELPRFRASALFFTCAELIFLGERNFLWFWRNSMLLQWRRGVRGLEYNTLYIMMKEIVDLMECRDVGCNAPAFGNITDLLPPFIEKARRLLILERHALQKGHITYERCDDPEIQKLRGELFSESKSHGGKFKELIDEIDSLLFLLLS